MTSITFILPTFNRKEYLFRAIESSLSCRSDSWTPYVLVIDGYSDDGSYELLISKYKDNTQVEVVQYNRIGFQDTAFYGVGLVKTEYAAFMYDDDVITPDYIAMIDKMISLGHRFVMGFGKMYPVEKVIEFSKLHDKIKEYNTIDFLLNYFGQHNTTKHIDMPVSPICCVVTSSFMHDWVKIVRDYCSRSKIRTYYMLKRNIGPDILIFLASILRCRNNVLVADEVVGQFSYHDASMSIIYGSRHLEVGYWLGKRWAVDQLFEQGQLIAAEKASAYLLVTWLKILVLMLFSRQDRSWFFHFYLEGLGLARMVASKARWNRMFRKICTAFGGVVIQKIKRYRLMPVKG
ncbi:MAG: glycosyltransferase family 2 protein [Deltaproteobacteria bacterium]|nr:glycosyltransferase family 2 protein [Deltaproteobacteria bacterium]